MRRRETGERDEISQQIVERLDGRSEGQERNEPCRRCCRVPPVPQQRFDGLGSIGGRAYRDPAILEMPKGTDPLSVRSALGQQLIGGGMTGACDCIQWVVLGTRLQPRP